MPPCRSRPGARLRPPNDPVNHAGDTHIRTCVEGLGELISLIDGFAEARPLRARASQITRSVAPHGTRAVLTLGARLQTQLMAYRTVAYNDDAAGPRHRQAPICARPFDMARVCPF
jgi:hypothetical protein